MNSYIFNHSSLILNTYTERHRKKRGGIFALCLSVSVKNSPGILGRVSFVGDGLCMCAINAGPLIVSGRLWSGPGLLLPWPTVCAARRLPLMHPPVIGVPPGRPVLPTYAKDRYGRGPTSRHSLSTSVHLSIRNFIESPSEVLGLVFNTQKHRSLGLA